jgi:hypothetical protein
MDFSQVLGYIYAILGGCIIQLGVVLQKLVINKVTINTREAPGFMKILAKNPVWIIGMILNMAGGGIFTILAQALIGGALVPGLMASGFIILMIGSVKVIGEKLNKTEIVAIIILIFGIAFIGFSELVITDNESEIAFSGVAPGFYLRMTLFTIILLVLWRITWTSGKRKQNFVLLSISSGLAFALGNIYMQSMLISISRIFSGITWIWITFIISAIFVGGVNVMGIIQMQNTFKVGEASKIIPIQQIPTQIVPVLFYFVVFLKELEIQKVLFSILGVGIIIICGFILSKKQAKMDAIK